MLNEKTGLEMLEAKGIINLSDDISDYGPDATEEDIQTYRRFIADHAPNADVVVGASYEAGWTEKVEKFLSGDEDEYDETDGDEWLNRMWGAFPGFSDMYA